MTLPSDLEIFWPSLVHQPCANTRSGGATPADIRKAGQNTQWKRMMSLPTMCRSAGQYFHSGLLVSG